MIGPAVTAIVGPEKGIEPCDMIHMEMREEKMIDFLNYSNRNFLQTPFSAIKKQVF